MFPEDDFETLQFLTDSVKSSQHYLVHLMILIILDVLYRQLGHVHTETFSCVFLCFK